MRESWQVSHGENVDLYLAKAIRLRAAILMPLLVRKAFRDRREPFADRSRILFLEAVRWQRHLSDPTIENPHGNTISRSLVRLPKQMEDVLSAATGRLEQPTELEQSTEQRSEQNRRLSDVIQREYRRLFQFIWKRVGNRGEAEDILQDVFYELIEAYRLMQPIEQVGAWLYRVARNRIIDRFRRQRPGPGSEIRAGSREEESLLLEDLLPSREAGPEAAYARSVLFEELEAAIDELPEEQRSVFVAHELEGRSFKEIADVTGLNINTLLSRKRYAIVHLRRRLKAIYE